MMRFVSKSSNNLKYIQTFLGPFEGVMVHIATYSDECLSRKLSAAWFWFVEHDMLINFNIIVAKSHVP